MTEKIDFVALDNGRKVNYSLYGAVLDTAHIRLTKLGKDTPFTSKQLLGHDFWSDLSRGEQSIAGMCLLDAARKGLLPISEYLWAHEYPKKFQIN